MPSLIQGYEYDIFISYRQKDNRGDRWVSEFVEVLKTELESTFKEEISVYFDINPQDGLLETHDVDASLKEKLKCLIFIPIISRTYCDPKSFAWEHELKAFVEEAGKDQFGLKVKLAAGNVANRVLPVIIHDLDNDDIKLCESVLGGFLRGVEFIYKEPGVNRPLNRDDDERKNLNSTRYRNQINKVALAIKDIIRGLKNEPVEAESGKKEVIPDVGKPLKQGKSIIVLPFDNISSDPEQEYFSDGLTEEIITDLSHIHDLLVISRSSAMTFKGTKMTVPEIARAVNVRYALEGSVRKSGNNLRITAQLIDSVTDAHLWAERYTGTLNDVFEIQDKVSSSIADALKIKLNPEEQKRISEVPVNLSVYEFYFKAKQAMGAWTEPELRKAEQLLQKGIELAGENTLLYSLLGYINYQYWNLGYNIDEKCLKKAADYVNMIFEMEPDSLAGYFLKGTLELAGGTVRQFILDYKKVLDGDPNHTEALFWMSAWVGYLGKVSMAVPFYERLTKIDPLSVQVRFLPQWFKICEGKFDIASDLIKEHYDSDPEFIGNRYLYIWDNVYLFRYEEAVSAIDRFIDEFPGSFLHSKLFSMLKYALTGERSLAEYLDPNLEKWAKKDLSYSYHIAQCFSLVNEAEKAMDWLEVSINLGGINYPFLNEYDPLLKNIRTEPGFDKLMKRVKYEWENLYL